MRDVVSDSIVKLTKKGETKTYKIRRNAIITFFICRGTLLSKKFKDHTEYGSEFGPPCSHSLPQTGLTGARGASERSMTWCPFIRGSREMTLCPAQAQAPHRIPLQGKLKCRFLSRLEAEARTLVVGQTDSVDNFKKKIEGMEKVPINKVRLISRKGGKILRITTFIRRALFRWC